MSFPIVIIYLENDNRASGWDVQYIGQFVPLHKVVELIKEAREPCDEEDSLEVMMGVGTVEKVARDKEAGWKAEATAPNGVTFLGFGKDLRHACRELAGNISRR